MSQKLLMDWTKGQKNQKRTIENVKKVVKKVDETIKRTDKKIQDITRKIAAVKKGANEVTGEVFKKYEEVKRDMRAARRKLRRLADKTKIACEELEIYIEGWEYKNEDRREYLKEQIEVMKDLMKESIKLLTEAEEKYKSAINNISSMNSKLTHFQIILEQDVKNQKAADNYELGELEDSRYYRYGLNAAVSVGLLIADFFGCFGICSVIGNAATWVPNAGELEDSIETLRQTAAELDSDLKGLSADIEEVKAQTSNLVSVLEFELTIVSSWKNNAENLQKKLDVISLDKFERLKLYRQIYQRSLTALKESADAYLNQPGELFPETLSQDRFRFGRK